ncbi:MAG: nucleotide exchange factor GrpE, partial [Chloroflexi bacterium]|nr:nucleotide exchange factor GrpE [Chloroflexota bacterium]
APADPPAAPPTDAERIEALELEVAELKDAQLRALADLLNFRRRSEQNWTERARATLVDAVSRYLPLLDDLDRALANVDADIAGHQWVQGIGLVHQKFHEAIAGSGLAPIETAGLAFDPRVHEAIAFAPGAEGQIMQAVRAGYAIQDHVVRPAQVVVGDGSAPYAPPASQ